MDCFLGLVSLLFFVFTFALCLAGLGFVTGAIYFLVKYDYLADASDSHTLSYISIFILVFGVIVVVLGFLGCCGTCKKSKCMLYLFGIFLTLIIVAELTLCIFALVEMDKTKDSVKKGLQKTAEQYLTDESTMKAWDEVQSKLECCGAETGASDWNSIINKDYIPASCCKANNCGQTTDVCPSVSGSTTTDDAQCVKSPDKSEYYDESCASAINDVVKTNLTIIAIIGFIGIFLELLGVFSAFYIGGTQYKSEDLRHV